MENLLLEKCALTISKIEFDGSRHDASAETNPYATWANKDGPYGSYKDGKSRSAWTRKYSLRG